MARAWKDMRQRLELLSTADTADLLRKMGVERIVLRGLRPFVPVARTVVGRARTLRMLPEREDIKSPPNGPINRGLYDTMGEGEILVIDAMGIDTHAVLGDMMMMRLRARQVAAVICDGAVRDIPYMQDKGLPIFAKATSPAVFMGCLRPFDSDVAIQCGGVLVEKGDVISADSDGVVVIPYRLASAVADLVDTVNVDDTFSRELLSAGFALEHAYPLTEQIRSFLPRFQETGQLPHPDEIVS